MNQRRQHRPWYGFLAIFIGLVCLTTHAARGQFTDPKVEVTVASSRQAARPGDQVVIAVLFEHAPGWHIHTNDPKPPPEWEFEAIKTEIRTKDEPGLRFGRIQWPTVKTVHIDLAGSGTPLPYDVFEGRAIAYLPVMVEASAQPGTREVSLTMAYQACDDTTCDMPLTVTRTVRIDIKGADDPPAESAATDPSIFSGFNTATFGELFDPSTRRDDVVFDVFGYRVFNLRGDHPIFLVMLLLAAALGGFILNLTPCVIPVIPIKIMSLSAAAGNPARCLYLGLVTSAGIIFFWIVIGACIAFIASFNQVSQLFQQPLFTIGIGLFVALMALGMLGFFSINLPSWVYRLMPSTGPRSADGSAGGSTPGTFLFGVFTAVLSTPCTAPFMATASAWAAKQPPALSLATFGAIGVGMAFPYALLSANPRWVSKVPRSGPASHLVKQVMGILMVGVAVFFLGTGIDPLARLPVDPPIRWFWWIVALCIIAAMSVLVFRTFLITRRIGPRLFWTITSLLFAASGGYMAIHFTERGPIPWVAYTPERFDEAVRQNKVIVLDFTAEWCLNCKALEAGVLHRPEVVAALTRNDVVPMRVDLTGNNVAGGEKLKSLDWVGIPLLAISGPGAPSPAKFDTYTPQTVLDAISAARGSTASARP